MRDIAPIAGAWLIAIAIGLSPAVAGDAPTVSDTTPIFNGKDFTGWQLPKDNVWWSVEDGVMVAQSGPQRRGSILWTKKVYRNFIIECEFRYKGKIDSGIFLRTNKQQVQIGISGSLKRDMTASIYVPGKGYPGRATGATELLKEEDEWNHLRAEVRGKTYDVWLNGKHVLTFAAADAPREGPIGLQLHGNRDMRIDFRNIRAAELPPAESTVEVVQIKSTMDGQMQSARVFLPSENDKPVPLVVALHTWSSDYTQTRHGSDGVLDGCRERGWAMIFPDFRGPNNRTEACASPLAVQDVLDAIAHVRKHGNIDNERIYLHGISGGGHMALMMLTRAPDVFAGASVWVPVTDLAAWHGECKQSNRKYWRDIEKVCGGPPGASDAVDAQYRARSPLFALEKAKGIAIDLNVGIHDGHTSSIPITHSLRAFNRLAKVNHATDALLTDEQIDFMEGERAVPNGLKFAGDAESGRRYRILHRRTAGPVRLTIFNGGHDGEPAIAFQWFDHRAGQSGEPTKDRGRANR